MATYYVRPAANGGSDAAAGTAVGTAWATLGKALGAAGIASGDTLWVQPATYRELINVQMTSATGETFINGDVDGSKFGVTGPVIFSSFLTNDTTAPDTTNSLLRLQGRDFLTFQKCWFYGASASNGVIDASTATSTSIKLTDCYVTTPDGRGRWVTFAGGADVNAAWVVDRCLFYGGGSSGIRVDLAASATADYDANVMFQNCTMIGFGGSGSILFNVNGAAGSFFGGGIRAYNCRMEWSGGELFATSAANLTTNSGKACAVRNSFLRSGSSAALSAGTSGQIVEDYNFIVAGTPRTNVTAGANSIVEGKMADVHVGQELVIGQNPRPFGTPLAASYLLGRGSDAAVSLSVDGLNRPRPAGGNSASKGWGALERHDTMTRDSTVSRSSGNSGLFTGPGDHEYKVPVDNLSTTITIYARYASASYGAGTKPQMVLVADGEIGITAQTATATVAAADAWEQLSLTFTPINPGIATIRLVSNAAASGLCYFDDFAST